MKGNSLPPLRIPVPRKPEPDPEPATVAEPGDLLGQHKAARALLARKLAEYNEKLAPELENILSAKALTIAQAEETTDLDKLDQLSIRIRSLEIREHALASKTDAAEKWLQATLAIHIERDERLAAYWDDQLLRQALVELQGFFPDPSTVESVLQELAPKTRKCFEGRIKVPPYSYAFMQPLEPFSEKRPVLGVVDPIFAPPKREDTVKCLLETASAVLECELLLFERLKGDEQGTSLRSAPASKTGNLFA
jgi:hypothetical protein